MIEIRLLAFFFQYAHADYRCHRGGHNVQGSMQRDRLVIDRVILLRVKPGFFFFLINKYIYIFLRKRLEGIKNIFFLIYSRDELVEIHEIFQ